MTDKPLPKVIGVQVQAHIWGNPGAAPADVRAALNPAPQAPGKNDKTQIIHSKFDIARNNEAG